MKYFYYLSTVLLMFGASCLFAQSDFGTLPFNRSPGLLWQLELGMGHYHNLLYDMPNTKIKLQDNLNNISGKVSANLGYQRRYYAFYSGFNVGGPITTAVNDSITQHVEYNQLYFIAEGIFHLGGNIFISPELGVNYSRETSKSTYDQINLTEEFKNISKGFVYGVKINSPILFKLKNTHLLLFCQYLHYTPNTVFSDVVRANLIILPRAPFYYSFGPEVILKNDLTKIFNIYCGIGNYF